MSDGKLLVAAGRVYRGALIICTPAGARINGEPFCFDTLAEAMAFIDARRALVAAGISLAKAASAAYQQFTTAEA